MTLTHAPRNLTSILHRSRGLGCQRGLVQGLIEAGWSRATWSSAVAEGCATSARFLPAHLLTRQPLTPPQNLAAVARRVPSGQSAVKHDWRKCSAMVHVGRRQMAATDSQLYSAVRETPAIRRIESTYSAELPVMATRLALHVPTTDLTHVGLGLYRLDLEMRRTAALHFHKTGAPGKGRASPLPPGAGGLRVVDIAPGSVDAIVEGFGLVATMLSAAPVSAFVNTLAILDWLRSIRVFDVRGKGSLFDEPASDIFGAIGRETHGSEPKHAIDPTTFTKSRRQNRSRVTLPNGTRIEGARVAMELRKQDGSERLIIVAES